MSRDMAVSKVREFVDSGEPIVLDIGCGGVKRNPRAVGIDVLEAPDVDLVGDAREILKLFPDASVSGIETYHFLEHVENVGELVDEMSRVLRVGSEMKVVVPHFSNPYYYSDPTHKTPFGLYSLSYFAKSDIFRRGVPSYGRELVLNLERVDLVFRSPFIGRRPFKFVSQRIFNFNPWLQEFWEENLSGLIPCYEVVFRLRRC